MNLKKILLFIFITLSLLCHAQTLPDNSKGSQAMKQFNIEEFNRNKVGNRWDYTLPSGELVNVTERDGEYREEITSPFSLYRQGNMYYGNGKIKIQAFYFYKVSIGNWLYYDASGNLIKEVNYDADFKFSIDDVAKMMLDRFGIDIYAPNAITSFIRYVDEKNTQLPLYMIAVKNVPGSQSDNAFVINGNDGSILLATRRIMGDRSQGTLYDEFIRVYPNK